MPLGNSRKVWNHASRDGSVDLAVTSPPYWHIKDYGVPGQIGYGQSLHDYLRDLYRVWRECFRALRPGGRLCVNVGDQFARAAVYGRYKVIPLHAEIIGQGEELGFDFMGAIIWQKKTTMNTTGGAPIMGSYPFPPNGLVEIDYEFILIFKKPGPPRKVDTAIKEAARLTREEWKEYFAGHWRFGGAKQVGHEAMFPDELPRRLIRMFTFTGDTVLDPFLGSGTTVKAALDLGRNAVGYEINAIFEEFIREKIGMKVTQPLFSNIQVIQPGSKGAQGTLDGYKPRIQNSEILKKGAQSQEKSQIPMKVLALADDQTIRLENGQAVRFLGVRIEKLGETRKYLRDYVVNKEVIIKDMGETDGNGVASAYVYLKNKIFINAHLIKSGLASPDEQIDHRLAHKFRSLAPAAAKNSPIISDYYSKRKKV
jgi:modification methylase